MKKDVKCLLSALVFAGISWGGYGIASAAGDAVYELNPVVVTATRTEKADVDVPATTTVITAKDIQKRGYKTVSDALEQSIGITSYSYANGGESVGGSVSRVSIRGLDKGTLVLVNGAPVNIMNYASADVIPVNAIEKIEIIKGANSVLYGAEAMAGVVNIITKDGGKPEFYAEVKYGNYDKGYQIGTSTNKFTAFVDRTYRDSVDRTNVLTPSQTYGWSDGQANKTSFYMSGKLTDKLSLDWSYLNTNKTRYAMEVVKGTCAYTGNIRPGSLGSSNAGVYRYDDVRNNVNLIYNDQDSKYRSVLAYNNRKLDSHNIYYDKKQNVLGTMRGTNYNVQGITFDNQKTWDFNDGKDKLIGGITFKRELYKGKASLPGKVFGSIGRNAYSVYSSYSHQFNDRFSSIVGVRGEFTQDNGWDDKHNVFLPQLQLLYKINDGWSLYSNVGRSFDMPAINSKFNSDKINRNMATKPQDGWSYEFGSKYINGKDSLKLAIFHLDIDNKFDWVSEKYLGIGTDDKNTIQINVGKYKNTGFESEYQHVINSNWSYNIGLTIANPKNQDKGATKDALGKWKQADARVQGSAGIQYTDRKWTAGLNLFVTADREDAYYKYVGKTIHKTPERIQMNSTVSYAPNDNQAITLNLYNLLDRRDSLNKYENWDLPFNWTLTYKHSF